MLIPDQKTSTVRISTLDHGTFDISKEFSTRARREMNNYD